MTPRTRSAFRRFERIDTRWSDEDVYGHVNNVVYYSYFDTAVNRFLMDVSCVDIRKLDAYGVVAETGCLFHRALNYPAAVEVGIRIRRLGNSSVTYDLAIFQGADDQPAATGKFVHVYVDAQSRQVVPIPPVLVEALKPYASSE